MSTTCEASEDEKRGRSGTSTPAEPNFSPPHTALQIKNQFAMETFRPSNPPSGGANSTIQVPEPSAPPPRSVIIAPPPTMAEAAEIVRRREKKQLERIKIFPQKRERETGIDSPTLREIANQNAKQLRVDDTDC